jgi:hypothetical protein
MTRGRKYPAEDIERGLQALAEYGGNAEAASRAVNIPANTLRGWKIKFADEFGEVRREKRSDLIEKVWQAAHKALEQVLEKMTKASAKEAAVILGILVDKGLLLGGEPTEISKQMPQIVFRNVDDSEYEEREQE